MLVIVSRHIENGTPNKSAPVQQTQWTGTNRLQL